MGDNIPAAKSADMKLNIAKKITIKPAVLKNIPDFNECDNLTDVNEIRASTGKVPSTNTSMMIAPCRKLPLAIAFICMDCVKPQGRKKVSMPSSKGANLLPIFSNPVMRLDRFFGILSWSFLKKGKTSRRLMPKIIITMKSIMLETK